MSRRAGKVRLGDVLSVKARIGWQGLTQKEHRETGEYNLVTGTDFVDGKVDFSKCVFVDKERYDQDENIQLRNGDLLITKDGTIGKVAVVENMPRPATLNSGVFVVRDVTSSFLIRYLYHFFLAPEFRKLVDGKLTGCTIAHLNQKVLVNLTIPLPPLSAQQRIADELDRLCALKKNAEDRLAILDQIVKSRFVEMFGDETELSKLADETELITKGTTPTSLGFSFVEEGVNFVKIETFCEDGSLLPNKVAHITEECHHALRRSQLKVNDVLFSIAGAIGRVAVVDDRILPANTNQALAIIRLRTDARLIVPYLVEVLKSEVVSRQYMAMKQGVAQLNISLKNIGDFRLPVPPLALQREFAAFVAEVDKSKLTLRETVATLDQLYRAKLQKYFG